MRTTMSLDDRLAKELMAVTGAKSRTEAIHRAIAELIRRKKLEELKALFGKDPHHGQLAGARGGRAEGTGSCSPPRPSPWPDCWVVSRLMWKMLRRMLPGPGLERE